VLTIELRHPHAAEAHLGNCGTGVAELTRLHDANVFDLRWRSSVA
jgi:hypothetical protein